ncbi:allantoate amidohydrolase [Hansschlegelia sp. KR7-227]|uniref:allantoate amidohydrolase n=1 Tax=Hansschlegelia sp. KR7-227 TaxID=3400914 RepID=UPI003BFC29E9
MSTSAFLPRPDAAIGSFRRLFDRFAACGATPAGGVDRQCGTPADGEARNVFASALRGAGAEALTDAVGNQFGIFRLSDVADAPLVMMGSHLDSQPLGGRFDGALGVAAAAAVGETLLAAKRAGARFDADFCAVNWTNEEGARFRPSLLGSGTYVGAHDAAFALSRADDDGVTLREALGAIGAIGANVPPPKPASYLELHVEQGTVLEEAGATIGIVTRNWGAAKIDVTYQGEQAHTGPCPMPRRRDALLAAAYLITDAREIADRWPGVVHTSVGRIIVAPNSPNVVPSEVRLSLEIRSADDGVLAEAGALGEEAVARAAERANVVVGSATRNVRPIRALTPAVADLVELCACDAGLASLRMDTVAGHDALSLLGICPIGLVFVPSIDGVAHSEGENTSDADIEAGFATCLDAASRLCRAGGSPERVLTESRA